MLACKIRAKLNKKMNTLNVNDKIDSQIKIQSQLLNEIFPYVTCIQQEVQRLMMISFLEFNAIPFVFTDELILTQKYIPFMESYQGQRQVEEYIAYPSRDFPFMSQITDGVKLIDRTNLFVSKLDVSHQDKLISDLYSYDGCFSKNYFMRSLINGSLHSFDKSELIFPAIYR